MPSSRHEMFFGLWGSRAPTGRQSWGSHPTTHLEDHSGLLQQVGPHVGPNDVVPFVKANLNVLPKTTAVVIARGFRIANGLVGTNVDKKRCSRIEDWLHFMTVSLWQHPPPCSVTKMTTGPSYRKKNKSFCVYSTSFGCLGIVGITLLSNNKCYFLETKCKSATVLLHTSFLGQIKKLSFFLESFLHVVV